MNVFKGSKGPFWTLETIAIFIKWESKHCKVWRDFKWVFWGPAIEWSQIGSMSRHISCPLIGASLACSDWRGDRDVGSGWGNRPSNQQRERLSGGGDLHRPASFCPPIPERTERDKFRKPSGMACSRLPNTMFSRDFATTRRRAFFGPLFMRFGTIVLPVPPGRIRENYSNIWHIKAVLRTHNFNPSTCLKTLEPFNLYYNEYFKPFIFCLYLIKSNHPSHKCFTFTKYLYGSK